MSTLPALPDLKLPKLPTLPELPSSPAASADIYPDINIIEVIILFLVAIVAIVLINFLVKNNPPVNLKHMYLLKKIKNFISHYLPDILVISGITLFTNAYFSRRAGLFENADAETFSMLLFLIGLDIAIKRYLPKKKSPELNDDVLYGLAKSIVLENQRASATLLQRKLKVGYAQCARLLDMLEEEGIVGSPDGTRPRRVLKK